MKNLEWNSENIFFQKDKTEWKLNTMIEALSYIDNLHTKIQNKVIHIAGTNGKGSTCNFIKNILEYAGYKVGLFTSPHLINYNERIYFNKRYATDEEIKSCKTEIISKCKNIKDISYFEITTLIAIMLFAKNNLDYCIFEVGLGGRLDATNIFDKKLATIITSISYDHMDKLGNTLKQITREKCGIIKENVPIFSSNTKPEIVNEIIQIAKEKKAKLFLQNRDYNLDFTLKPSLSGSHQFENATLAKEVCKYLKIDNKSIQEGISNTTWYGRLQKIKLKTIDNKNLNIKEIYLDGAHNEDGIRVLCNFITETKLKNNNYNIIGIFSCLKRKQYKTFFQYFANAKFNKLLFYNVPKEINDFVDTEELMHIANKNNISNDKINNFEELKKHIDINTENIIFIFGSLYFVGYILENFTDNTFKNIS